MIRENKKKEVPTEWTNDLISTLVMHAQDLGHSGNVAGYCLGIDLFTFVGETINGQRIMKTADTWDYEGIRGYLNDSKHHALLQKVWQLEVEDFDFL